ncbi:Transcription antiterminator LicT [Corynebacterium atrinae]|uniref:CAT RNA binding domain-containing protein n=1 Tax=Corynebacterium atrinae TaxID=1336740 RepID=UPI0025B531A9|nr:CAT RNA binding domain-containing protein [Corynebacterium atrinae]WJY64100.1 Transcription antiterminator LicT [Corynebacterium atrinae]
MKVVRVLNNNVVLATDDSGREVILTGWGVGFKTKPGAAVDVAKMVLLQSSGDRKTCVK